MKEIELIQVIITMLSYENGGRVQQLGKAAFGGFYRPHLVIGDPNQRKAIIIEKMVLKII